MVFCPARNRYRCKKVQDRITAQKLSKEQASMIMETTSNIASDFSKGIFTREKELLGSLESLGFIDESGKFLGRSGALASQDIAEEINITDIKEAIKMLERLMKVPIIKLVVFMERMLIQFSAKP